MTGEIWGLEIKDDIIYTAGDDNQVNEWSIVKHTLLKAGQLMTDAELKTYKNTQANLKSAKE
jgi:hypothetical protein